jgi:two-component system cell cycle sensor histidine kinase/response regulator CckA
MSRKDILVTRKPIHEELEQRKLELEKDSIERSADKKYKDLTEQSLQGFLIIQEFRIVFANRTFAEISGYTVEELYSLSPEEVKAMIHPEDQALVWGHFQSHLEGKPVPPHYEYRGIRKDGAVLWLEMFASRIEHRGKPAIQGEIVDITEPKQTEEELRLSEERYRVLIENCPLGIYYSDFHGRFLYGNKKAEQIIGYQKEELQGKNFLKLKLLNPKDIVRASKLLALNMLGKATGPDEFILNKKDGSKVIVEISTEVITIEEKRVVLGMVQDITERKRAETILMESEERYRTLFEDSRDAIYITSREGRFIDANQSAFDLFGYSRDEMTALNAQQLYANPNDSRSFQREIEKKGFVRDYELKLRKKDGTEIDCLLTTTVRRASDGGILGYQGIIQNITEKRKLEAQLIYAQKMEAIGTLAAGIAHNFNNLLMAIMGNTSLMLLDIDPTHPHYERLRGIEKSVQSGSKLTSQLLGYARGGRYEIKPISLNEVVRDVCDTLGTTRKDIKIHLELAEGLRGIIADGGQIEQVLLNLSVNAVDAMPRGGDLFLMTMNVTSKDIDDKPYQVKPGNYVMLRIRDTGVGMDKKTLNRIFDPFFTTKGLSRGTGLGLASAYGIIKSHGGYIDVDSRKGHGTTFCIYLPASGKKLKGNLESTETIIEGRETVLLVDDEEMVLDVGVQLLKALGYTVLEARTGKEAIDLYKANEGKIDIVILDMIMPGLSGGEVFDRIKALNPRIKVLLSSGYSIDGQAKEILERGCDGFIQKPFSMNQLSQTIREILDLK